MATYNNVLSFPTKIDMSKFESQVEIDKAVEYLASRCEKRLQDRIREVYSINTPLTKRENYIPLEEMLSAVDVKIKKISSEWWISIYINEDMLKWRDASGNPTHEIASDHYNPAPIKDLGRYWQMPINGLREDRYFLTWAKEDIKQLIKKNFANYVWYHTKKKKNKK